MVTARCAVRLIARRSLSSRVHRLRCRAQPAAAFRWAAGQYLVVVRVSGVEQALFLPYSIASAYDPLKPGEFELAVAVGVGADAIDLLTVGAELEVEGPFGDFVWQPVPRPAALLIGVGTGVAPLRAMVEEELARESEVRLLLIAGHRLPEDVLFSADFAALAVRHPRFEFLPTLSGSAETAGELTSGEPVRPTGNRWPGARGRVQAQLPRAVRSLGPLDAYICGRLDMVHDVTLALEREGVPPARIRREGF